ncbi:MAG: metal-sensing transcriptional repressor [Succiniclasticum sp.]|nr:metal-sensing transcriptional repressor [Succiniclasticum sp.]
MHDTKERSSEERKNLLNRLKRIEGQVRGLEKMVEEDAYCPNVLVQASAVSSAINSFNKALMAEHIRSCVVEDIRDGNDATIEELISVLQKLMK